MLILGHAEVRRMLEGVERQIVDVVRETYWLHDEGRSIVPLSSFLRFPDDAHSRIIALPAYLSGRTEQAGLKWVSSFPRNIETGLARASAAILLNSTRTGHPTALIEASLISAKRTAASAALAAGLLRNGSPGETVGLIGCGVINFEIMRFLRATNPGLSAATVFDLEPERAEAFRRRCDEAFPGVTTTVAPDVGTALSAGDLVSVATTAVEPHMDLQACGPDATVLHVSLRDLHPNAILASQNVVDDPDHVCRERTSLHLAEQLTGNRDFIDAPIGRLIREASPFRRTPGKTVVFSPFGLGVLDLTLARLVVDRAAEHGVGRVIDDFLPSAYDSSSTRSTS